MKTKKTDEYLHEIIMSIEEALWSISEIREPNIEEDLQTAKELIESGRDLFLEILKIHNRKRK